MEERLIQSLTTLLREDCSLCPFYSGKIAVSLNLSQTLFLGRGERMQLSSLLIIEGPDVYCYEYSRTL
jgi:hypothetical protein